MQLGGGLPRTRELCYLPKLSRVSEGDRGNHMMGSETNELVRVKKWTEKRAIR